MVFTTLVMSVFLILTKGAFGHIILPLSRRCLLELKSYKKTIKHLRRDVEYE